MMMKMTLMMKMNLMMIMTLVMVTILEEVMTMVAGRGNDMGDQKG